MARSSWVSADMIGLVKSGRPTKQRMRPPPATPPPPLDAVERNGLMIQTAARVGPVSAAFTGFAYLRRLAEHRRRVQRELARLDADTERAVRPDGRRVA